MRCSLIGATKALPDAHEIFEEQVGFCDWLVYITAGGEPATEGVLSAFRDAVCDNVPIAHRVTVASPSETRHWLDTKE